MTFQGKFPVFVGHRVGGKLIVWGGSLLVLLIIVRAVAPAVQDWSWRQEIYADRMNSDRAPEPGDEQVSVETIVARPKGLPMAASTCGDADLETRVEKMLLVFARKLQPDKPGEADARVAAAVMRAKTPDPRLAEVLKKDCHRTLELAEESIAKFEK